MAFAPSSSKKDRDDFDRSFELFESKGGDSGFAAFDSWFGRPPTTPTATSAARKAAASGPSLLETDDIFEFSATASVQVGDDLDSQSLFFPDDPFAGAAINEICETNVRVAIHEQLSALYDDTSADPACQIEGCIVVKKPSFSTSTEYDGALVDDSPIPPFCLLFRDLMDQLERCELKKTICEDISASVPRQGLHKSDRVLKITVPKDIPEDEEIPILNYFCAQTLRPVPMLIKSRVQVTQKYSRAGFKIRANPTNKFTLTKMVIILAVPPYVRGDNVKMSRRGGVWDEMKRTISWTVDLLTPGEALEVQVQFESMDGGGGDRAPKFPVLVRAECPMLFSSVELKSEFPENLSVPVQMKLSTSGRVLHRKV